MACPFCSAPLPNNARFCAACGRALSAKPQAKQKTGACGVTVLVVLGLFVVLVVASYIAGRNVQQTRGVSGPSPNAQRDVMITATCRKVFGQAIWSISLENTGKSSYRDLLYRTNYEAQSGTRLKTNRGELNVRLAPGEKLTMDDFNDGPIPQQTTACAMVVFGSKSELGGAE